MDSMDPDSMDPDDVRPVQRSLPGVGAGCKGRDPRNVRSRIRLSPDKTTQITPPDTENI